MRAAVLILVVAAGDLTAQDATSALDRAELAYRSFRTLQTEFRQTITNPMLGDPEVSRGMLYLVKPGRFAMRFTDPAGDRLVADGRWLWVYTPSTVPDQVIRQEIPRSGATTPNIFAQFVDGAALRYNAEYGGSDTVSGALVDVVYLLPVQPSEFRNATLFVDRTTGLLRRLRFTEESGQHRQLEFTELHPDAAIPDSEVSFRVPSGTRVVTP